MDSIMNTYEYKKISTCPWAHDPMGGAHGTISPWARGPMNMGRWTQVPVGPSQITDRRIQLSEACWGGHPVAALIIQRKADPCGRAQGHPAKVQCWVIKSRKKVKRFVSFDSRGSRRMPHNVP